MNLNFQKAQEAIHRRRGSAGVALVITLLMLSVITFLAIAFLYMSRRNQSAVSASLDQATARSMSDAAVARAETEALAQMLAHGDPLYYDYMVSSAYHSFSNFDANETTEDPNNVNYDTFFTNLSLRNGANYAADWAQNIANLQYDPEPPVFVDIYHTAVPPTNYDFRFWVDINRNGKFETNGYQLTIGDNSLPTGYGYLNGEPEFIGVLRNPLYPHSSTNLFIGRYAYLVLPIGKELDLNYIHNFLKYNDRNTLGLLTNGSVPNAENDGFARDQGIGSWELNLAGLLDAVSPWAYESNNTEYPGYPISYGPYNYFPPSFGMDNDPYNKGNAFDDAEAILHYRYPPAPVLNKLYLAPLDAFFPTNYLSYYSNYVDMFCENAPLTFPFDYYGYYPVNPFTQTAVTSFSWPGSYQTNQFFDVQDLFDPNKTSANFTNRMIVTSERTNSWDRYTFERLLSCIAMGSSPEYGVWVNRDLWVNSSFGELAANGSYQPVIFSNLSSYISDYDQSNQTLRTKVNLNFDNTAQIYAPNAPYAPMPTTMSNWWPIVFFTNAAELLLRSQTFAYSNFYPVSGNHLSNTYNITYAQFGVTNIPIYRTNEPGVLYDPAVHRMLQLAANIYDATVSSNFTSGVAGEPPYRIPSVFRPVFGLANPGTTNVGIDIIGYQPVNNSRQVVNAIDQTFYDLPRALSYLLQFPVGSTAGLNINIWGIPWIVATDKGLPEFYQYSYQSSVLFERKMLFARYNNNNQPDTNRPPQFTNQFYCFWVSNNFGLDGWNQYPSNFSGSNGLVCFISNYVTVQITNNYNFGYTTNLTNYLLYSGGVGSSTFTWPGLGQRQPGTKTNSNGFVTFFSTNVSTVPPCYYSQYYNEFVPFTNVYWTNSFLPKDTNQTPPYPAYNWTLNVTNHLLYALFDGRPGTGLLLDFVNLGPFGTSTNLQLLSSANFSGNPLGISGTGANPWIASTNIPFPYSLPGLLNQIANSESLSVPFLNNITGNGSGSNSAGSIFGAAYEPSNVILQLADYVANDPIVHYTIYDLTNQALSTLDNAIVVPIPQSVTQPYPPLMNNLGGINWTRYSPWGSTDIFNTNMLLKDPGMISATNWDFPTSKFPGVGWLGRVHRGTPWQTVYFKSDNPLGGSYPQTTWATWNTSPWLPGEVSPETYPTNDWALVDLFTTAPNDNAARGLLSVNQTNDAAWAAVFAGVIAPTSADAGVPTTANTGVPINPTNVFSLVDQFSTNGGINWWRNMTNAPGEPNAGQPMYPNGIFHKVGDILGAPALTVASPFLITNGPTPVAAIENCTDETIERIPQQTLSLLKVGEPQFVIWAWGQALRGKGPPYLGGGPNNGIYTNYEITGEVLTRTVCHVVHTNGLKIVVDSFNVESGTGN